MTSNQRNGPKKPNQRTKQNNQVFYTNQAIGGPSPQNRALGTKFKSLNKAGQNSGQHGKKKATPAGNIVLIDNISDSKV